MRQLKNAHPIVDSA